MKRIFKTVITLLFAAVLALSVAACAPDAAGGTGEKVFRYVSSWDANLKNHFYSGTTAMPLSMFSIEGLYNRLDTVDVVTPQLADGMPVYSDDGLTTTIKIKENAKWQNGDDFVAMDVVAFYYLNHTQITRYMLDVQAQDAKTVVIHWNPKLPVPSETLTRLLALDMHGTVNYNEFRYFADTAIKLITEAPDIEGEQTSLTAFGKYYSPVLVDQINKNFAKYRDYNPSWYVSTGAFKLKTFSVTQMLLEKNPLHWAADNVKFDKIIAYTVSDTNQLYNMLAGGELDYADGLAPIDTLDSILGQNKNMIHIKMADTGTIGLIFNMEKSIWSNPLVRKAFQYIFDRDAIRELANPYGLTQYNAPTAMCESDRRKLLKPEHEALITKYEYSTAEAEKLLNEAGWSKKSGSWYNDKNEKVKIQLGGCSTVAAWSGAADVAQAQLLDFGIDVVLKKTDIGTMYGVGTAKGSAYDCVISWTETNPTITHPYGSFSSFDNAEASVYAHLPQYSRGDMLNTGSPAGEGMLKMDFPYLGERGGIIGFSDYMDVLYTIGGNELLDITGSVTVGLSDYMYGVNFFQSVTGSFINVGTLGGVPLEQYWSQNRNVSYVPELRTQDSIDAAGMNFFWSDTTRFVDGSLYHK